VAEFAFRSNFDLTFRSPKRYKLVATGQKTGETTDGKELITTWKSDIPLAAAGFAFGDYKLFTDKVGDVEIQVYANNQPDDLLRASRGPLTTRWMSWHWDRAAARTRARGLRSGT